MRNMTYKRGNRGFTMSEVLIVIAILGVMAALVFVNAVSYMKTLYQKEMDETAQELYIAAQNHLSIADSVGFLDGIAEGDRGHQVDNSDVYYYVLPGDKSAFSGNTVLARMLPLGSIDDTVRSGGSYVISYNLKTA